MFIEHPSTALKVSCKEKGHGTFKSHILLYKATYKCYNNRLLVIKSYQPALVMQRLPNFHKKRMDNAEMHKLYTDK